MAREDGDDFHVRPDRSRGARTRGNLRDLPFTRQVELAVRKAGGNPGRNGSRKGGSGRFNAPGLGARAIASFPRDGGGWQRDSIGRFRPRRVVVKARVVKLAPRHRSRGPKVRGVSKAADAYLRYRDRDGVTRDGEKGRAYTAFAGVAKESGSNASKIVLNVKIRGLGSASSEVPLIAYQLKDDGSAVPSSQPPTAKGGRVILRTTQRGSVKKAAPEGRRGSFVPFEPARPLDKHASLRP